MFISKFKTNMIEQLTPIPEANTGPTDFDQVAANQWLQEFDDAFDAGAFRDPIAIKREFDEGLGAKEYWQVIDAVNDRIKDEQGNVIDLMPMVTLQQGSGEGKTTIDVPVVDFLRWQNNAQEKLAEEDQSKETVDDFEYVSDYTQTADDVARLRGLMKTDEQGEDKFAGRSRISRDTTDPEGMVDTRGWLAGSEAIVVDSTSPEGAQLYAKLLEACTEKLGVAFSQKDILQAIYDTVSESLDYDADFTKQTIAGLNADHRKVNLSYYLQNGKGVCRHMALGCQWLGARMAEKYPELFEGASFTTPVSRRTNNEAAHEWARFTDKRGEVYILDPAQKFMGTLKDAVLQTSKDPASRWEYCKDAEEKRKYIALATGDAAIGGRRSWFKRHK